MTAPRAMTTSPARQHSDDLLGDVLRDVIYDVPYSSVAPFYAYFGDAPAPERFGMACAWQSYEVGRRLAALGGPPVTYLVDGRHVAAVVRTAESLTVLDPYLLHTEPLRFDLRDASRRSVSVASPALPFRRGRHQATAPGRVRASWSPGRQTLRLEYLRFSPVRGHNVLSRVFTLSLDAPGPQAAPPSEAVRPLLLHPEQNTLSIRVVDRDRRDISELLYPLTGAARRLPIRPRHLLTRDNNGAVSAHGEPGFRSTLAALASSLSGSQTDVCEFVLGGVAIYRRVAPATLTPHPYVIGDE